MDGHTELLVRQLSRAASGWRVQIGEHGARLTPGTLLVLPAGKDGLIESGVLQLRDPRPDTLSSPSANVLLTSLAEVYGPRAVGVILSGTGSDGAAGCRAVRRQGGRTYAQSDAQFPGMATAAVAAKAIDQSVPLEAVAAALRALSARGDRATPDALSRLLELVRRQTGHDFQGYKRDTLRRRATARMAKLGLADLQSYAERASGDPAELARLRDAFLVSLSSFFRDAESFECLRGYLRQTLQAQASCSVWVPGCATGEEVYSLAMILHDLVSQVRIVGSDLNAEALAVAVRGSYPQTAFERLDPALVELHFQATPGGRKVRDSMREMVEFRLHDALDGRPPVQSQALVSCRNLLIYLRPEAQQALLQTIHQALAKDGLLFLGPAESLTPTGNILFRTLDAQHRIFQRRH